MFELFKKSVNTEKITNIKEALAAIDLYVYLEEWDNAEKALKEVKIKEMSSFQEIKKKFEDEPEKIVKAKKNYDKNLGKIEKEEKKFELKKSKYDKNIESQIFKLKFKKITEEIRKLIGMNKNNEALNLLTNFLEENKSKSIVITFYAKEKKKILKNIEKVKRRHKKNIKENDEIEALKLIGKTIKSEEKKEIKKEEVPSGFFGNLKNKLNIYKKLKVRLKRKKLLDEVKVLIEEEGKIKEDIARKKLENIHKGLTKELIKTNIEGFDLYGKILGHDKISGDTFDFSETIKEYNFFLGDATGHGVRAGLIISLLSRNFKNFSQLGNFKNLIFKINNNLKEELESRNFVTGVFFRVNKQKLNSLDFIGMGHEPMLVYKNKDKKVEKVIPGGLAIGIRKIKEIEDIKIKNIELGNGDIVLTYSDGVTDVKNMDGDFYGIERLKKIFLEAAKSQSNDIMSMYNYMIEDLELFKGGTNFSDDTTMLIVKRDQNKDKIKEKSDDFDKIIKNEGLNTKESKRLIGKNKQEIENELNLIKREKETKHIISILENLYLTGEILKLKEEATRFIKDGFIHKKINFYLRKAIANETEYKISQKNQRIQNRYNTLLELYKSGDFNSVIDECQDIIIKNGDA